MLQPFSASSQSAECPSASRDQCHIEVGTGGNQLHINNKHNAHTLPSRSRGRLDLSQVKDKSVARLFATAHQAQWRLGALALLAIYISGAPRRGAAVLDPCLSLTITDQYCNIAITLGLRVSPAPRPDEVLDEVVFALSAMLALSWPS